MLAFELKAAQQRLEERTKNASHKAFIKAEKERLLSERQRSRQQALEEEKRQRRIEQLRAEEEASVTRQSLFVDRGVDRESLPHS